MVCIITAFIPILDHSLYFEKVYFVSYFLEHLDDVDFFFTMILVQSMNTHGIDSHLRFIISTLASGEKRKSLSSIGRFV